MTAIRKAIDILKGQMRDRAANKCEEHVRASTDGRRREQAPALNMRLPLHFRLTIQGSQDAPELFRCDLDAAARVGVDVADHVAR